MKTDNLKLRLTALKMAFSSRKHIEKSIQAKNRLVEMATPKAIDWFDDEDGETEDGRVIYRRLYICPECKGDVSTGDQFCRNCGQALKYEE